MTGNEILKADLLDIIFDNRNKQYGAYALRKYYNDRLSIALALALSTILLLVFFVRPGKNNEIITFRERVVTVTDDYLKPVEKKPEPPKQVQSSKPVAQKQYTSITLVDHTVPPMNTLQELQNTNISIANIGGVDATPMVPQQTTATTGTGETKPAEKPKEDFAPVERAPQFPGGNQAWLNFLNRNLHSPADIEAGDKKIVKIKFDVAVDGSITNFQIIQSAGNMFDNEVIRVLKKMPKWLPAIQNGKPVSVSFTQPVTFVGVEE